MFLAQSVKRFEFAAEIDQNELEIKIFAGRFSTSVARQVFHQLFRSTSRVGDFITRRPNLWPEIQISAGTIDLQAAKQMPFMRLKIVGDIRLLSAASAKESLDISNRDRIFSAAGRGSKALLEIAPFQQLSRFCARHFGAFAGNPTRRREFQRNRWKSAEVAEPARLD